MGGLWTFPIVLPDNPLKWLNCYVIKAGSGGRDLLIDTGFNRPECRSALLEGMAALEMEPEKTDVFLTHFHSDHAGNAGMLQRMGSRIFIGSADYLLELRQRTRFGKRVLHGIALREGMPREVLRHISAEGTGIRYLPELYLPHIVRDGTVLSWGGYKLRCLFMPGHTPGHMCLYDAEKKLMLLGDHILYDITPNICAWPEMKDSLGAYISSLKKIREYDAETALPGHRAKGTVSMRQRADELIEHHDRRLAETESIIEAAQGASAYEIAPLLNWSIRAGSWDSFPPNQQWFAFWETLAHLDHMAAQGRISKRPSGDGVVRYYK